MRTALRFLRVIVPFWLALPAFVTRIAALRLHNADAIAVFACGGRRHADGYWFCVHLVVVFGVYSDGIGAFRTHFPGFRHADGTLDFQRFRASLRPVGCAIAGSRVSLSLAAQHGGLAPGDWGGLLVRWWFENSRAYLYYFFIVNDCQFVAGHVRMVPRDRSNGGEVFVRCAFPYKAIVNFLISRVIVSMSLHEKVFLWRVRFWLRMNAGGVLNTCKSNGIPGACSWVRVANG